MKRADLGQRIFDEVGELLDRYQEYAHYLSVPHEWGERAIRGWLVYDLFHEILEWPVRSIVLGEQFDALFVDDNVKPKLYLETKNPERGLADLDAFKDRVHLYGTLRYAIITDGYAWARFEVIDEKPANQMVIDRKRPTTEWHAFFTPLHATGYLYTVR